MVESNSISGMVNKSTQVGVGDVFPDCDRYIYQKSPLRQVICQLRFPQILKIEAEVPASFQERVKHKFPLLVRGPSLNVEGVPPDFLKLMLGGQNSSAVYNFSTEVGDYKLTIDPQNITLTTEKYERWEIFKEHLDLAVSAFVSVYSPTFYTRVGLRYTNAIDKRALSDGSPGWDALINQKLLGELALPEIGEHLLDARRLTKFQRGNEYLQMQHGLFVQGNVPDKSVFLLDSDFFTERTDVQSADAIIERFHSVARRVFRWAISDDLHGLLGPSPC